MASATPVLILDAWWGNPLEKSVFDESHRRGEFERSGSVGGGAGQE